MLAMKQDPKKMKAINNKSKKPTSNQKLKKIKIENPKFPTQTPTKVTLFTL